MRCESEMITLCSQSCGCEEFRRVTEDVLKEAGAAVKVHTTGEMGSDVVRVPEQHQMPV